MPKQVTLVEDTEGIVGEELNSLATRIIRNMEATDASASGQTAESLRVETTAAGGILWGRKYFGTTETGRRAGGVPKGFYQVIRQWAIDKGIVFENEPRLSTFAYFVAKKIAADGTKLHRDGGRDTIYSKEIPETIERIKRRVSKALVGEVTGNSITINT